MMKIIKISLFAIASILLLVIIGFFLDRNFVSYYKVENQPHILKSFAENFQKIFGDKAPVERGDFLENFGEFASEGEQAALRAVDYMDENGLVSEGTPRYSLLVELMRLAAQDLKFLPTKNIEISYGSIWAKNDNIKKFCERPYIKFACAQFFPDESSGRRFYADIEKSTACISYREQSGKFDFPMEINGKSLWSACGFIDDGKTLILSPAMAERLKRRIAEISR